MKNKFGNLLGLLTVLFMLTACGSRTDQSIFNTSPPEIKHFWDQALTADQANDYLTASTNYTALLRQSISAEQLVAVQAAVGALNERMQNAAAKGDAAAQKAIADLKNLQSAQGTGRPGR